MNFAVFELPEMAEVLGMPLTKARNWTIGRPLELPASVRKASGAGTRNLYSIDDVYLMGVANEFSKAGFAAKAIGKLVEALDASKLANMDWLTVYRMGKGEEKKFYIREGKVPPPEGVLLWMTLNVGGLVKKIDRAVEEMQGKAK